MSVEAEVFPKMKEFLFSYGLQITLKTFIDALDLMIQQRGPFVYGTMVVEGLRGLYKGYLRRYEVEDYEESLKAK